MSAAFVVLHLLIWVSVLSCALLSVLLVAANQHASFSHVQSCFGLERAEGRFWELLPTSEGGVSVLLAPVGTPIWSPLNAAVMVHGVSIGVSKKDPPKEGANVLRQQSRPSRNRTLGDIGTTWMAWFPGLSKLEVPGASGTATFQRSRVAARDISRDTEGFVKRAQVPVGSRT